MNRYYDEDYKSMPTEESISGISGAGGGCFPAGTLVRTVAGFKAIEHIAIGEHIISYDRFGELDSGFVTATPVHAGAEYTDDLYFIYSEGLSLFPEGITGNHAVYDVASNEHKEIKNFIVGEALTDINGKSIIIEDIVIQPHSDITVYNLIVEPQHTYIVGKETPVRVHNGGGGKSSSQAAARTPVEAANTLQSSSVARVLEVLSQGTIVGVIGGAKGVVFNNTAVMNADNSVNFEGITFEQRIGLPEQTVIPGFTSVESELVLAGAIITDSGVTEQLPGENIDAARVTIRLTQGLSHQNITNGDLNGYTVSYNIYTKDRSSSTWNLALSHTISDKSVTPAEVAHRITKPSGATLWDIKVTRTSPEDTAPTRGVNYKSEIVLARITQIQEEQLTYPNVALSGITIPASSVGNSIPSRGYYVQGIKVDIPVNYNPLTQDYGTSYWNFAFKSDWTDNPAWVLLDLILNTRYGMATFLGQDIDVDLASFYEAAMYNDCVSWTGSGYVTNLIPTGYGGAYRRRFTFNTVISVQQDAWQLLHAVASSMRAILVMKGSQISLLQDRPKTRKRIINTSNVLDGMFVYSSSSITERATAINCTFNDADNRYAPKTISEPTAETKAVGWYGNVDEVYGYTVKDIVAYGVTNESEARAMAKWALYTEIKQPRMVAFSMALNVSDLAVGDVVGIMDDDFISSQNTFLTGRVVSVVGSLVTLSAPVTLEVGYTYTFGVMNLAYNNIIEGVVTNSAGEHTEVTLSVALPAGDYSNHEFFCYSSGHIEPQDIIIQSITESSKGIYAISGVTYDAGKFNTIEQGTYVPSVPVTIFSSVLPQVENIAFSEVYMNDGIASHNYINVTWDWDTSNTIKDSITFSIKYRRDNNPYKTVHGLTTRYFRIEDTTPGHYEVTVEVINLLGKRSIPAYADFYYRTVAATSTLEPPTEFYVKDTFGVEFTGKDLALTWKFPAANLYKSQTLLDYVLEVWLPDGSEKIKVFTFPPIQDKFLGDGVTDNPFYKGGSFVYNFAQNISDFGTPSRSIQLKLYSRDTIGDVSVPEIKTFTNPVPAAPDFEVFSGVSSVYLDITPPNDSDIAGYRVWRDTVSGFTVGDAYLAYDGTDPYVVLNVPSQDTYYYKVAAYDSFGKTGLNVSSQQASTPLSVDAIQWSLEGITFSIGDTNRIDWTSGTIYRNGISIAINAGNATWTTGKLYIYYSGAGAYLSNTTTLALAVGQGTYPLATYTGGGIENIKGGDGSAFISGSEIIAGTVGASALVTGTAVITETAQMANAIITNSHIDTVGISYAKIQNDIQSTDYNFASKTGWKIDKTGGITTFGVFHLETVDAGVTKFFQNERVIKVYDLSGTLRVRLGDFSA